MALITPLERLLAGNSRYVEGKSKHPNNSLKRRKEVSSSQNPFATIIGCSDSRVPPELIFDEGLGDLFVLRIAGNIIGPIELESIQFSISQLESKLILILGHQNCGAVKAVLNGNIKEIYSIAKIIAPATKEAQNLNSVNPLRKATELNALRMQKQLMTEPKISYLIKKKNVEVKSGYYSLETGKVKIL